MSPSRPSSAQPGGRVESPGGRVAEPAVTVAHSTGSYPVFVEPGALLRLGAFVESYLPGRRAFVIADATVAGIYAGRLSGIRGVAFSEPGITAAPVPVLTFPPGESSKSRDTWARLTDELLAHGAGRDSAIIALGGGVTGDLAGFVAATFHRGVPLLHVPTTLLAMVDSSVGGKTGVNTGPGKNLVGAFHPPVAVVADPAVLATLDDRHFRGGLAEAVKHGWMLDGAYFEWLEAGAPLLGARNAERLAELIRWSVRIKSDVVSGDERDEGRRAVLNAGHTIGHAIERASGWTVPHGDAVAVGLVAEAEIAVELGLLDRADAVRLRGVLTQLGLPATLADLQRTFESLPAAEGALPGTSWGAHDVLEATRADKKNRTGTAAPRFALPAGTGRAHRSGDDWTKAVEPEMVLRALR